MPLILLILGFVLIIYNYIAIKKDGNIKNNSFENVLKDNKDGMTDYKIEIGLLRKDIAESLTELQEEILDIKTKLSYVKEYEDMSENKSNKSDYYELDNNNIYESSNNIPNDRKEEISENEFLINYNEEEGVISEINFSKRVHSADSSKTSIIKNLLEEGLTDEEICHKLSVSKGEVLLVKGLFKN